jgi:1-phosphofructokinase
MLKHLGERPLLCGPVGGEAGQAFRGLLGQWKIDVSPVEIAGSTPIIVHDRRSGDRQLVASSVAASLARHEVDDIYGRFLDRALTSALCVVTGQSQEILPPKLYRRLGHDLAAAGIQVVADLHGPELWHFLEGGPIDVLKVSDEDLESDGLLEDRNAASTPSLLGLLEDFIEAGAKAVVLSRQDKPALARFGPVAYQATAPEFEPADHRGAGDSMTAGLTSALRRGLDPTESLRLACAAGAANVTRHGLGSADGRLVPGLSERIEIVPLSLTMP